ESRDRCARNSRGTAGESPTRAWPEYTGAPWTEGAGASLAEGGDACPYFPAPKTSDSQTVRTTRGFQNSMTVPAATQTDATRSAVRGRWWQLLVGIICMSMIANLQYGWTLFVNPINEKYHWGRA